MVLFRGKDTSQSPLNQWNCVCVCVFLIEYYPKLVIGELTILKAIVQACFLLACCTPLSQASWPVFWQMRWVRLLAFVSHTGWM